MTHLMVSGRFLSGERILWLGGRFGHRNSGRNYSTFTPLTPHWREGLVTKPKVMLGSWVIKVARTVEWLVTRAFTGSMIRNAVGFGLGDHHLP